MSTRIPIGECLHGGLYRVEARNFSIGVYSSDSTGFIGIRQKFGTQYLDTEYHWDIGAPHGTASPKELLCMVPDAIPICESLNDPCDPGRLVENLSLFLFLEDSWNTYCHE